VRTKTKVFLALLAKIKMKIKIIFILFPVRISNEINNISL
jgi:hypothetical protein